MANLYLLCMESAYFCSECGKTVLSDYLYCPWCGRELKSRESLAEVIDHSFSEIEKVQAEDCLNRLEKLTSTLNRLEDEINGILSAEK